MKSIAEIGTLESAYVLGGRTLGYAALALKERWDSGLRDQETFIRYMFMCWYRLSEPVWYTGLDAPPDLPMPGNLYESIDPSRLEPDSLFVLGVISHGWGFYFGDEKEWEIRSIELLEQAATQSPESAVFTNWRYVLGETDEPNGLRKAIAPELHARFHGRGYMGDYILHICRTNSVGR